MKPSRRSAKQSGVTTKRDAYSSFSSALALQKKGDVHAAFEVFRQVFLLPNVAGQDVTLELIAGFMHATASPEEEIAAYREAIRLNPKVPKIHGLFAQALESAGEAGRGQSRIRRGALPPP